MAVVNSSEKTRRINDLLKEQKEYLFPGDVKVLSTRLFNVYADIKPNTKQFGVAGTHASERMICLEGTIPVNYRGAVYNIPIIIWIPKQFPRVPPIPRVTPTATMSIKASKYVDTNGTVFLPYLHEWTRGTSDLCDLVQTMGCVFSEAPPVYAKQANPPPHMVMPATQPGYYQPPGPFRPPPNPGYPYPPPPQRTVAPYPAATGMPLPYSQPYPAPGPPPPAPPPAPAVRNQTPYPPSYQSQAFTPHPVPLAPGAFSPGDRVRRDSLVSAVQQKVREQMDALSQQSELELSELRSTNQRLRAGNEELKGKMSKIQQQQVELDTNVSLLERKGVEIQQAVLSLQAQRENFCVDNAIMPTAPLYTQILNLYARQCAIEDALYYLGEGLRKKAIPLEDFLQNVRELSTDQYRIRKLLQKACQKAAIY